MKNFIEKAKSLIVGEKFELPKFTQETGISQIRDLESLEKLIKFLAPEKFFQIETNENLKYVKITPAQQYYNMGDTQSVRVGEENGKLKISTHGPGEKYEEERFFEKNDISGISKDLPFLVSTTMPILEYRLFLQDQGKNNK